jgi:FKBP-type peptidyl-prolyl cis-trans isomerase
MKYNNTRISRAAFSKTRILKKPFLAVFLCALIFSGCKGGSPGSSKENIDKNGSYALGMDIGQNLKQNDIFPNMDEFVLGLRDALGEGNTRFTHDEAIAYLDNFFTAKMRQVEIDFLAENTKNEGIKTTPSGLQYEVIVEGSGAKPGKTDTVQVNYEGTFINGDIFDSSRGAPVKFALEDVIPGWTEGIQLMSEGSTYQFFVPSALAYGSQGYGQMIPPYSALIFRVELLAIMR